MGLFNKFKSVNTTPLKENILENDELTENELEGIEAGFSSRKEWLLYQIQKLEKENEMSNDQYVIENNKKIIDKYNNELNEHSMIR